MPLVPVCRPAMVSPRLQPVKPLLVIQRHFFADELSGLGVVKGP